MSNKNPDDVDRVSTCFASIALQVESGTYVLLSRDSAENVAVSHDDNVVFGAAAEVLSYPLGSLAESLLIGGVKALLAGPVGGQGRKVKALELGVALEHLLGRTSVAREGIAFLELRQQDDLAQATESLNGGSIANLGTLQRALEGRREDDLGARLQVVGEGWQTCRLLLAERCQWRIWDRVVVGNVLFARNRHYAKLLAGAT